jgi:hypothetical protein
MMDRNDGSMASDCLVDLPSKPSSAPLCLSGQARMCSARRYDCATPLTPKSFATAESRISASLRLRPILIAPRSQACID